MGHATLQDVRSLSTPLAVGAAAVAAAGVGSLAYARWEADRYLLRQVDIPVLASGPALRVLHISDLHLAQHQPKRERWVAALADLTPDLVEARVRRDLKLPGGGQRGILVVMALGPERTTLACLCLPV